MSTVSLPLGIRLLRVEHKVQRQATRGSGSPGDLGFAVVSKAAQNAPHSTMPKVPTKPFVPLEAALPVVNETIGFICRRQRCTPDEKDEFASYAHLRLIEDQCAILRHFEGRSELRTYLAVVLQRMFIDFRRHHWGIWRPSAEARRLGPIALLLDRLVSRDGMSVAEAVETAFVGVGHGLSRPELTRLAEQLPRRARRRMEGEEALLDVPVAAETAESSLLRDEREGRAAQVRDAIRSLLESLEPEDAVILRFRFQDGLTVARIAQLLQLDAKPLYRRVERLLVRLRSGLEAEGVASEEVGELLSEGAFRGGEA